MNQNHSKYAALMLLFTFISPSFAMGGKVFTLARFVGVTATPVFFSGIARDAHENCKDFDNKESLAGSAIDEWGKEKIKRLNVANGESISFVKNAEWVTNGKRIGIPSEEIEMHELIKSGDLIHNQDEKIALHSIFLKHEVGHAVHNDVQARLHHMIAVPFGIEAISFGATKGLRKLCNIQPSPKTFIKAMVRSCFAIGSIAPKTFIGAALVMFLRRQQETQADQYAYENAESRLELEKMVDFLREEEVRELLQVLVNKEKGIRSGSLFSSHPAHGERRALAEKYVVQWDRKHSWDEKRA